MPPDPGSNPIPGHTQPLVAAAVAVCLVGIAAWVGRVGGCGGLADHDAPPAAATQFTVNVNAAGVEELAQLPGLGVTTAARIVDHRREHGPFVSLEALLDVPGIGAATLDRLRPHLRPIRTPPRPAP